MILTPHGTPFETNIPSYGLALAKADNKTIVSGIWNNSSTFRSGIKVGDEVEFLNNKGRQKAILQKGMLLPDLD
jgi:hypothetical protein